MESKSNIKLTRLESEMEIIVWENKYDDKYYDASTPELKNKSALMILQELVNVGYIIEPSQPEFSEEDQEILEMSKDALDALPVKIKEKLLIRQKELLSMKKEFDREKEEYDEILRVLAGEKVYVKTRSKDRYSEDDWDVILKRTSQKSPDEYEIRENGIYLLRNAWWILSDRNGAEYEHFSIRNVITPN